MRRANPNKLFVVGFSSSIIQVQLLDDSSLAGNGNSTCSSHFSSLPSLLVLALRLTAVSGASLAQLSHAAHTATPAVRPRLSFRALLLAGIVHALSNTSARSFGFWVIWVCMRSSSSSRLGERRFPNLPIRMFTRGIMRSHVSPKCAIGTRVCSKCAAQSPSIVCSYHACAGCSRSMRSRIAPNQMRLFFKRDFFLSPPRGGSGFIN